MTWLPVVTGLPLVGSSSAHSAGIPLARVARCARNLCLSCLGRTSGPHGSFSLAALVAAGPDSSASRVGPALSC